MTEIGHMASSTSGTIRVPRLKVAVLRNFSLFNNAPMIRAEFGNGVFCLAGANGLGKSTFLAALNFGITGIVADPDRKFESVPEYYRFSQSYSGDFFRGRISSKDREAAQIELEMDVGNRTYRVVRGMFDPIGLRELSIVSSSLDGQGSIVHDPELDENERHNIYTKNITRDAGLKTFAQLVFLQHFVLTFDERRHLLFWDEKVAQSALFIAFGIDPEHASRADIVRRNYERADSLVRNLQWQATDVRKRMEDISATLDAVNETDGLDIGEQHQRLLEEREAAQAYAIRTEAELQDARLRVTEVSARRDATRVDYERLFRKVLFGRRPPETHPVVVESVDTSTCAICGTESPSVSREISVSLGLSQCPLCKSDLSQDAGNGDDERSELSRIDQEKADLDAALGESTQEVDRLMERLSRAREQLRSINLRITEFENANEIALSGSSSVNAVQGIIEHYRSQIAELQSRKQIELDKRADARQELRQMQDELAQAYAEAEDEFVPKFTTLAREFLGLDLDIRLQTPVSGAQLLLSVMNNPRRAPDKLSESQRFFIEIALRMALVQQISEAGLGTIYSGACCRMGAFVLKDKGSP
jgi:hypothetical protein